MAESIILPQFMPPSVDLSGYALKTHSHDGYATASHTHSQYLTSHQSLYGYATQSWVKTYISSNGGGESSMGGGKLFASGIIIIKKLEGDSSTGGSWYDRDVASVTLPKAAKYICIGNGACDLNLAISRGGFCNISTKVATPEYGYNTSTIVTGCRVKLSADGMTINGAISTEGPFTIGYLAYE